MNTCIQRLHAERPPYFTTEEAAWKVEKLRQSLAAQDVKKIIFTAEGAVRWLTGLRNQIVAIGAAAASPVHVCASLVDGKLVLAMITNRIEMCRLQDEINTHAAFFEKAGARVELVLTDAFDRSGACDPQSGAFSALCEELFLSGTLSENSNYFPKLRYANEMTLALLIEVAYQVEPGMDGMEVFGVLSSLFYRHHMESNLFLIGLSGQEGHLHPLYNEKYKVKKEKWFKLVAGGRDGEHIASQTVLVNIGGGMNAAEVGRYQALQQATAEYADCYRPGITEAQLFDAVGETFARVGLAEGIGGFREVGYHHHLGGPTSPLGNRDYVITKGGAHTIRKFQSFAINPVDPVTNFKVEAQGITGRDATDAPLLFALDKQDKKHAATFRCVETSRGTKHQIIDPICR